MTDIGLDRTLAYPEVIGVTVQNWPDSWAKPPAIRKTILKTWIIDPAGLNGVTNQQICEYEPKRTRMVIQVPDQSVALTTDPPVSSPDKATAGGLTLSRVGGNAFTAAPAAGAESITTVPAGEEWTLDSWAANLTTNATVANRVIQLIIDDGAGNNIFQTTGNVAQAASLQILYQGDAGATENTTVRTGNPFNYLQLEFPLGMVLKAGWRIRTLTTNIQAGDQWSGAEVTFTRTVTSALGSVPPQGRFLPASTSVEYQFFGPDAMWINSLTGATIGRVTVTKEYC